MKIKSLRAENVKRLSVVDITPTGNLVEVTGENGQGKTSVLDSIWYALAGQGVIAKSPIRQGEQEARIKLDIGDLVVTRTFRRVDKPAPGEKDFTTKITVANADGGEHRSPQALLDGLLGTLCFDPLAFTRMEAKKQFDELRKFVPDVDFDKIEAQQRADYTARAEVNRERERAKAAADIIDLHDGIPDEEVDEAALSQALANAAKHNSDVETRKANRVAAVERAATWRQDAQNLRAQAATLEDDVKAEADKIMEEARARCRKLHEDAIARAANLETQAAGFIKNADELQKKLDDAGELPAPVDVDELNSKCSDARVTNAAVRRKKEKAELQAKASKLDDESKALTARMDAREAAKREAIAKAKLPVEGLGFGDGVILLKGLPFEQASDAERLRVSCAIAMASNPKLRVIRVRDGSLLDAKAMTLLGKMADENDMQVWVETVDSRGRAAVVLEDGHIKETSVAQAAE